MNTRSLKIALGVSVALNLFAIGAGASLYIARGQVERQVEAQVRPAREGSPMRLVDRLSVEQRPRVRAALRASALAARPDFELARDKRREAVAMAAQSDFEPDFLAQLLAESRAAEQRGRARLESDTVALLNTVSGQDRVVLAEILKKRGRDRGHRHSEPAQPQPPNAK